MKKRVVHRLLGVLLASIMLLSIAHVTLHTIVFQTDVPLAKTIGISGHAVGKIEFDDNFEEELRTNYPQASGISRMILIGEWALLLLVLFFFAVKTKVNIRRDHISVKEVRKKDKSKTDIDLLYDLLKDKKKLRISTISQIFKVDKQTVKEWAEILENNYLAEVNYPRIGEPEIVFNENGQEKKQE